MSLFSSSPKVICITGCSSGLGFELAKHLSQKHIVYATARDPLKNSELAGSKHPNLHVCKLDVCDPLSIERIMQQIDYEQGHLDVLINNAGLMHMGFFEDVDLEVHRKLMETNYFGVVEVTQKALRLLKKSKDARIINISSTSGVMAMPTLSAYAATKWALEGLSEGLRHELSALNIKVLLIEPGLIDTPLLHQNFKSSEDPHSIWYAKSKELTQRFLSFKKSRFLKTKKVVRIIEKRMKQNNPPFRTLISYLSHFKLFLKRIFPYSLYEKVIIKAFNLRSLKVK